MQVLLTTLNARYSHSSLALRYLKSYCQGEAYKINIAEYTINQPLDRVMAEIYLSGAEVVAFSAYIWNIQLILELSSNLKKIKPELIIILGGPEVSYNPGEVLSQYPDLDFIVYGEGEETFKELLNYLKLGKNNFESIKGLAFRDFQGEVVVNPPRQLLADLDLLPSPYGEGELQDLKNKLIYYETSRGCPFHCSYCLSSTIQGVRYFSLERVKEELLYLINKRVKKIKFVDRTFNAHRERALEIWKFLVENTKETSFHFEIAADLLGEEELAFLTSVPEGVFQLEIGVQSTYPPALAAVERQTRLDRLKERVKYLQEAGNIQLHLDLIAGLPKEDLISFQKSFNDVYSLNPHVLQLGFLKLLKGTKIRKEAVKYGYQYTEAPPYEVLKNDYLTYSELLELRGIEDMVEKYHNSGAFTKSIQFLLNKFTSPFALFRQLAKYYRAKGYDQRPQGRQALYQILYDFYRQEKGVDFLVFSEFLKYDYLMNNRGASFPRWALELKKPDFKERRYRFLQQEEKIKKYLPHFWGERPGKILKKVDFAPFFINVLSRTPKKEETIILFDYTRQKSYDITADF